MVMATLGSAADIAHLITLAERARTLRLAYLEAVAHRDMAIREARPHYTNAELSDILMLTPGQITSIMKGTYSGRRNQKAR